MASIRCELPFGLVNRNNALSSKLGTPRLPVGGEGVHGSRKCNLRMIWSAFSHPSGPSLRPLKSPRRTGRKNCGPSESDLRLVKDLKEFISAHDLPVSEVPTTKELMKSGRQDLANAVRRRGYKSVATLMGISTVETELEENDSSNQAEYETDTSLPSKSNIENGILREPPVVTVQETEPPASPANEGESTALASTGMARTDRKSNGLPFYSENSFLPSSTKSAAPVSEALDLSPSQSDFLGPTIHRRSDLQDRSQQEELEGFAGATKTFDLLQKLRSEREGREGKLTDDGEDSGTESNNDSGYSDDEEEEEEEDDDYAVSLERDQITQSNSEFKSPEAVAGTKAAMLRSRILDYFDSSLRNRKGDQAKLDAGEDFGLSVGAALERDFDADLKRDPDLEMHQREEAEGELQRIRKLLNEKERVLAELVKELEEAKAQFSLARAKATAELVHATQVAAERESRLQLAEQTLSSLRQVHLEWWGEARHVELAGTFNGWQHRIFLEPDPSSEIPKADGSRGPMMWGTHLCLYPGIYEIKFIVDGNWHLDHRREVVLRHGNQNNVLRVDL